MTYTQDQLDAEVKLKFWKEKKYESPKDLFFTLNGAAGTGKSTIVDLFLQKLGVRPKDVAVTAPTHKAKKEIENKTKYSGNTIQKLLGLRPNVNIEKFNINRPQFDPLGQDEIRYYKYIIIDESSMLNKSIYELIVERAIKHKVYVLFLGDELQLPPINETISKVFTDVIHKATLTTVVRQAKDNPMTNILRLLREDVINGTSKGVELLISTKQKVFNEKGFKCLTKENIAHDGETFTNFGNELLTQFYSTEYSQDTNFMKFISYTNKNVEQWNLGIREKLLRTKAKDIINIDEFLLGYTSITDSKTNTMILENSEDYKVINLQKDVSNVKIKGYQATLENSKGFTNTVFIVDHNDEDNLIEFVKVFNNKLRVAKQKKGSYWRSYYNFKNQHLLLIDLYYDNGSLMCKKDLFYSYGLTVHKSQGSTYTNVAINLVDLYRNKDIYERNRLIYVALSRATNMNLILVSSL